MAYVTSPDIDSNMTYIILSVTINCARICYRLNLGALEPVIPVSTSEELAQSHDRVDRVRIGLEHDPVPFGHQDQTRPILALHRSRIGMLGNQRKQASIMISTSTSLT